MIRLPFLSSALGVLRMVIGLVLLAGLAGCPAPPVPVAGFSADVTRGLAPLSVVFTNASELHGAEAATYAWSFGDGQPDSDLRDVTAVYDTPGVYTVSLSVTTDSGTDTETKVDYIVVTEGPTAGFDAAPTTGLAPLAVSFDDTSVAGTAEITAWNWSFGDGGTSAEQNPSHTYAAPGGYDVALTVTTAEGSSTETKAGFIVVTEAPTADFTATPTTGLGPLEVAFSDSSTPGTSAIVAWAWEFGDGATSAEQNPSHTYTVPGSYGVTLTVTTADGSDSVLKDGFVSVQALPTAGFEASVTTGVSTLAVNFTDVSVAGTSPIATWAWTFGDGGTSAEQNPSHEYSAPGNYDVGLTVTTAVGSDSEVRVAFIQVLVPEAIEGTVILPGEQSAGFFGNSVSSAGDVNGDGFDDVIVGDPYFNDPLISGQGEGRAYVYLGSASGINPESAWRVTGGVAFDWVGQAVGGAGDVNNDGYDDVLVGALEYTNGPPGTRGGAIRLYFGSASGLSQEADWTYRGEFGASFIGEYVGGAGDVNNDGYADFYVGGYSTTSSEAYVFFGSAGLPGEVPDWTGAPSSIAGAGDVNGDGYDDVICGTYFDYGFGEQVSLYYGGETGPSLAPDWTTRTTAFGPRIGRQMSTAGDVNGDGFGDVIVGADANDATGAALVFLGSTEGLSLVPDDILTCPDGCEAFFGRDVAGGVDFDGDGYGDVLVSGAYGDYCGMAYVFFGDAAGIGDRVMLIDHECTSANPEAQGNDYFALSLAVAGDLDDDGRAEIIVGNPMTYAPQGGRAHLYEYRPALPVGTL